MRVTNHPILGDERCEDIFIIVDGKKIGAVSGEVIASALHAAGIRKMRYTAKKQTPRGVFCGIGRCNDCKMIVDGVPNIKTCTAIVRQGMEVKTQHGLGAWEDKIDE